MRVAIHPIFAVGARDVICHQSGEVCQLRLTAPGELDCVGVPIGGRWALLRFWICYGARGAVRA